MELDAIYGGWEVKTLNRMVEISSSVNWMTTFKSPAVSFELFTGSPIMYFYPLSKVPNLRQNVGRVVR